jgi:hypothetical protein
MSIDTLIDELARLPASERLFNPYALDGGEKAAIRRDNLRRYLADMQRRSPHVLLLAEAPGYRGCALTGIPVTSERIMLAGIDRWGLFGEGYRATSGQPQGVAEMTATILWDTLAEYAAIPPVIWNTLPLHSHRPGDPQSNRTPAIAEQRLGISFVEAVLGLFDIRLVLAVGRKAQRTLAEMGVEALPLRHPSQGGKAEFVAGIRAALR